MNVIGERPQPPPTEAESAKADGDAAFDDRLLLSARDLRKALGVNASTVYRWMKDGAFPTQIHIGSLARWRRSDVDAWIRTRAEDRARQNAASIRSEIKKKVRGGRSRWASTASAPVVTESSAPAWEPRPTPLRGTGHHLPPGVPEPVHLTIRITRFLGSTASTPPAMSVCRCIASSNSTRFRTVGRAECTSASRRQTSTRSRRL
jgi:predicted DNA-binding transcriptional regulator AlpA